MGIPHQRQSPVATIVYRRQDKIWEPGSEEESEPGGRCGSTGRHYFGALHVSFLCGPNVFRVFVCFTCLFISVSRDEIIFIPLRVWSLDPCGFKFFKFKACM